MAEAVKTPTFIGLNNLQHIADKFEPNVIQGPAYFAPEVMERLRINVITGVQFKNTKVVLARKGGTTRRKVVGKEVENKIGYLMERPLVAKLTMNRYKDNRDNYIETPFPIADASATAFSYPLSEAAFEAVMKNYSDDLLANMFFGDMANEDVEDMEYLSLYDGYHTLINADIAAGLISEANGNLIPCEAIDVPTDVDDFAAWTAFYGWYSKWSKALQRQEVVVYCSVKTGMAIATAYTNKFHGNATVVTYTDDGDFKVKELPKVTFIPTPDWGEGDRMVATIPGNFEYGVDTLNSHNNIYVQQGSDRDAEDIIFQVQSVQGERVLNVLPSVFAVSTGSIANPDNVTKTGDYQKDTYTVTSSDTKLGTVTVNGATPDNTKEYAAGTTLKLKATATSTNKFVKWSNGATDTDISVVTPGYPDAIVAIFAKAGE